MSIAFLYPGQGSQQAGMLAALPDNAATRRTLGEAADALGDISVLDSAEALGSTTNDQLALLICAVAATRSLIDEYRVTPDMVAGHSAGAFGAAVTAGVLTFAEALEAVRRRGDLMAQACAGGQWGMAAVTGLPLRTVRWLAPGTAELWIANINSADQIVLGGTMAALEQVRDAAQQAGARDVDILDVPVASHGPIQSGTAAALAEYLDGLPRRTQTAAYMTNVGARRVVDDAGAVFADLAGSVAHPVRWYDIARLLPEFEVTAAVQMPPGHVLCRLVASAAPQVKVFNAGDGFDVVGARLGRGDRTRIAGGPNTP